MAIFRAGLLLAVLVPALYVASAAIYLPAVLWHGIRAPRSSALIEIRERAAAMEERPFEPRHRWVPLERISPHLVRAVIVAEDTRFHDHAGFDLEQIREAWRESRRAGRFVRGASTITQQTAKNLYLSPSRNVLRKLREAMLTAWIEAWLPKERILELYLNVVELGPGIFGAEAAAREYFGVSAAGLGPSQAAMLAATLPAPLMRNPASSTPGLRRRQRMILGRMARWYGGGGEEPSPAEEEAASPVEPADEESAAEDPAAPAEGRRPRTLESQPIEIP